MKTDDDVVPVEKGTAAAVERLGLFSLLTAATKFCEQMASDSRICPLSIKWSRIEAGRRAMHLSIVHKFGLN
jgi:hypothetical protein